MKKVHPVSVPLLRALVVLAIILSAFAHRAAPAYPPDFDLAEYTLPDGSLPSLCLPGNGGNGKNGITDAGCEFCRLAAAILLPEPPILPQARITGPHKASPLPHCGGNPQFAFVPNAPPTGPPAARS